MTIVWTLCSDWDESGTCGVLAAYSFAVNCNLRKDRQCNRFQRISALIFPAFRFMRSPYSLFA